MPKETFYRISEEKKHKILEASKKEFFSFPYNEVSINRIIKEAGIPRGSFYQYFEDKRDLFKYILESHKIEFFLKLKEHLKENCGDIFECVEVFSDKIIDEAFYKRNSILKMIFAEPKVFEEVWMEIINPGSRGGENLSNGIMEYVDFESFDIEDKEESEILFQIIGDAIRNTICNIYRNGNEISKEEYKRILKKKLWSIKRHYVK